ncbi:MAG TPA: HIT domain-containing protein [Candidatus Saccharimonadia bacterium]|nr:HIT domain-containing protein [Candidatus Saccharimonadia bacterium]
MEDCIFCKIVRGETGQLIWENDIAVAFKSINPLAPVHVLVVPKRHVKNLDALDDPELAGQLLMAVREVIKMLGLVEQNKILIHGLEIDHLHMHIMSDERYKGARAEKTTK